MCCITPTSPKSTPTCPNNPRISPIVELWKGLTKYAGIAAMGAFAAVGVLHYMVSGPNTGPRRTKKTPSA